MKSLILAIITIFASFSCCLAGPFWRDRIVASDRENDDRFGYSVSISNGVCVIGSPRDDDNGERSGSAYIYRFNGNNWIEEQKLTASDGAAYDAFGISVSVDSNVCVIGADYDDDYGRNSGSAYVFRFNGSDWVEEQKLTHSWAYEYDWFGMSVAIDTNVCVVGAPGAGDWGRMYIYRFVENHWIEEEVIQAHGFYDRYFGYSVSIDGDIVITGEPLVDHGYAYIFRFDGSNWNRVKTLLPTNGASGDWFGTSVSINGDVCVVGAYKDDDNGETSGSAYVFRFNGSDWVEEQKLLPSDGAADDCFGISVAIDGNTCVISAPGDDDYGEMSGSAYLFRYDDSQWIEEQKLFAFDAEAYDEFGRSLSLDSESIIVGASEYDYSINRMGSAYAFRPCPQGDFSSDCFVNFEDFAFPANDWNGEWTVLLLIIDENWLRGEFLQ